MPHFKEYLTFNKNAIAKVWHFTFHQITSICIISFNVHNDLVKYGKNYDSYFTSKKKKRLKSINQGNIKSDIKLKFSDSSPGPLKLCCTTSV